MGKHGLMRITLIVFLFFTPTIPSKASNAILRKFEIKNTPTQTDFNITHASSTFEIRPQGEYRCSFSLRVVGNEQTSHGNLNGSFRLEGKNLTDFNLRLSTVNVKSTVSTYDNFSVYSFTIDQELQPGNVYELLGTFQGRFYENESGIYTYHLGIDWGTIVGEQETTIRLDDRFHTLDPPIEPEYYQVNHLFPYISEIKWVQSFKTGFTANLNILMKSSPNIYLKANIDSWNASVGQTTDVTLENNGSFSIHGWIITPNWITSNVTEFTITPDQKLVIRLSISLEATTGMNDTIQIVIDEFFDIITILVSIVSDKTPESKNPNDLFLFFSILSLFIIIGAIGLTYHQRNNINTIIQNRKKRKEIPITGKESHPSLSSDPSLVTSNRTLTKDMESVWKSIHSRWQPILPENELRVIEILFTQGSMNQQTIAEKMGVSKMTMSRVISRLEAKRLLFRERLGMSNMIKLNKNQIGYENSS